MRACIKCGGSRLVEYRYGCEHDFAESPKPFVRSEFLAVPGSAIAEMGYMAIGDGVSAEHPTREGAIALWQQRWQVGRLLEVAFTALVQACHEGARRVAAVRALDAASALVVARRRRYGKVTAQVADPRIDYGYRAPGPVRPAMRCPDPYEEPTSPEQRIRAALAGGRRAADVAAQVEGLMTRINAFFDEQVRIIASEGQRPGDCRIELHDEVHEGPCHRRRVLVDPRGMQRAVVRTWSQGTSILAQAMAWDRLGNIVSEDAL